MKLVISAVFLRGQDARTFLGLAARSSDCRRCGGMRDGPLVPSSAGSSTPCRADETLADAAHFPEDIPASHTEYLT